MATVSNTVVRSVSVEQHEDSERVEKFVRYVSKYQNTVDIDYIQCNSLDDNVILSGVEQENISHISAFNPDDVEAQHEG